MSYEEFLITDRGMKLLVNIDIKYNYDGAVVAYYDPTDTILSKEFIENNNKFIEEELFRMSRHIENLEFAIKYKDSSYHDVLEDMYVVRFNISGRLDEFRLLVDRMYWGSIKAIVYLGIHWWLGKQGEPRLALGGPEWTWVSLGWVSWVGWVGWLGWAN